MSLLTFIAIIVIVGLILYLVNAYIPMAANVKQFLNIAVIIILVLWFLNLLGVFHSINVPIFVR